MPRFVFNAIDVQSQWNNSAEPTIVIPKPIMDRSIYDCSIIFDTDRLVDCSTQCCAPYSFSDICWERGPLRWGWRGWRTFRCCGLVQLHFGHMVDCSA